MSTVSADDSWKRKGTASTMHVDLLTDDINLSIFLRVVCETYHRSYTYWPTVPPLAAYLKRRDYHMLMVDLCPMHYDHERLTTLVTEHLLGGGCVVLIDDDCYPETVKYLREVALQVRPEQLRFLRKPFRFKQLLRVLEIDPEPATV
jgi:hypothetical protein